MMKRSRVTSSNHMVGIGEDSHAGAESQVVNHSKRSRVTNSNHMVGGLGELSQVSRSHTP